MSILVKDLIAQLSQLPPDSYVELFHEQYSGGGDEATFSEPVTLYNGSDVFITAAYLRGALEYEVGETFTTEELLK